jgi:hypothetical protein
MNWEISDAWKSCEIIKCIGADSPDIAERVIKKHKENKKMSTILCVANLIANHDCRKPLPNWKIAAADPEHKLSGLQRFRELKQRFFKSPEHAESGSWGFMYDKLAYRIDREFKRFNKRFLKERS